MLDVLYEDNHLLVVNKTALLPTMGVRDDRPSLLVAAKEYVRQKYRKPGNVYLGVVSRLDAPVTGVVLFARTSKSAARLTELFRGRQVEKRYWALVEGKIAPSAGTLRHFLAKDERHRRVHVVNSDARGAQAAELNYQAADGNLAGPAKDSLSFLEIQLLTGRKHQIRVQLAAAGFPVLGDRKYGAREQFPRGIALHSRRLVIEHPVRKRPLTIEAPLPASWHRFVRMVN